MVVRTVLSRPPWALPLFCNSYSFSTARSEEHTSELQSRGHLVCRLLLEKKNTADFTAVGALHRGASGAAAGGQHIDVRGADADQRGHAGAGILLDHGDLRLAERGTSRLA